MIRDHQLRLVYSLLKPAVRMAARFNVPIRSLSELLRLAYYEVLARDGLTPQEIAEQFGQSSRHMRSLRRRLDGDFFAAEQTIGILREVEDLVGTAGPREEELAEHLPHFTAEQLKLAVERLVEEERIVRTDDGRLATGTRYVVLTSEHFHNRIDALNHFLDGAFRATLQRLVFDEARLAMIKTITFAALPDELRDYLDGLEAELRRDLAGLEEQAEFQGGDARFTLSITLAGQAEPVDPEG